MKNYPYGSNRLFEELSKIVYNKYNVLFFILIIFSFALRFYFRSNYLDDWDSVQFVMGLEEYSIPDHQPHPPGYPLYILIGRIFYIFIGDSVTTFTLISAIFGTLALIPTFLISKKIFNDRVGLLSAVLLSFTPAQMLFSEVVMTDIVSLFFVTFTAYILYLGISSTRYLYFGALMVGITAGIRMTDIIMIILLLLVLIYIRDIKKSLISGLMVIIGIGMWLIPVIIDTGLHTLLLTQRSQWYSASDASTLSSLGGFGPKNLLSTVRIFVNLLIEGWSSAFIIFALALILFLIIQLRREVNKDVQVPVKGALFIICWLFIYVIFSNIFNLLYITRYLLPQFPPLATIFAFAIVKLIDMQNNNWYRQTLNLVFFISIIFMAVQGFVAITAIHTTTPPPVEAANFIKDRYDPSDIEVVIGLDDYQETYRHFQYYLPEFNVTQINSNAIMNTFEERKTIISVFPVTFYGSKTVYKFTRDPVIYPKHNYVELHEIKLNKNISEFIILGGWHHIEDWGGTGTRWMESDASLMIYSEGHRMIDLSFIALSFYRPRTLDIYVNDRLQMCTEVPIEGFMMVNLTSISLNEGKNILRFKTREVCEKPSDKAELNNVDPRCLSLAVQNIILA